MLVNISDSKERWQGAGVDVIPLLKDTKRPLCASWQIDPPQAQWAQAPQPWRGNIGVRMGNGLTCVDCDDGQTTDKVSRFLDTLGLNTPVVQTQRGTHFYLRVHGAPDWFNFSKLALGAGEFRVNHCYAVAPASHIDSFTYTFYRGSPDDLRSLRSVAWSDLGQLIAPEALQKPMKQLDRVPVPLLKRDPKPETLCLIASLHNASKGAIGVYESRSDAECSLVAKLILSGYSYLQVKALFDREQPGHYHEAVDQEAYLRRTYEKVLAWLDSPTRQRIARQYAVAASMPWPGAGGATDRLCYLALLGIGWQADCLAPYGASRDFARECAIDRKTASGALKRLINAGLIERLDRKNLDAFRFPLQLWECLPANDAGKALPSVTHPMSEEERCKLPHKLFLPVIYGESCTDKNSIWALLGRSAGIVHEFLSEEPQTVSQLAQATGKDPSTVKRALKELRPPGLAEIKGCQGRAWLWVRGPSEIEDLPVYEIAKQRTQARNARIDTERQDQRDNLKRLEQEDLASGKRVRMTFESKRVEGL